MAIHAVVRDLTTCPGIDATILDFVTAQTANRERRRIALRAVNVVTRRTRHSLRALVASAALE